MGRGLDALLANDEKPETQSPAIQELPVGQLEPNRYQPRTEFDETGLDDLAASIQSQGVVQPIVVTAGEEGRFTIIAGERRWRASQRAGLEVVPVVVRQVDDDQQLLEMALVENIQRADLNAVEEAEAYKTLSESFGLSQEDIAKRVGKGRTTITNFLRLLRLPDAVQDLVRSGKLSAGQARPLLSLGDAATQVEVAIRAVEEGLTARDLEKLVTALKGEPDAKKKSTKPDVDVHTREAMDKLTHALRTRVEIQRKKRGGVVRIHFHSEDELIRLYDHLMPGE
ncbi:MAG: ParB/RepB/Spo0J family partition protein [Acidobacteriota bacterium]